MIGLVAAALLGEPAGAVVAVIEDMPAQVGVLRRPAERIGFVDQGAGHRKRRGRAAFVTCVVRDFWAAQRVEGTVRASPLAKRAEKVNGRIVKELR